MNVKVAEAPQDGVDAPQADVAAQVEHDVARLHLARSMLVQLVAVRPEESGQPPLDVHVLDLGVVAISVHDLAVFDTPDPP